MPASFTVLAHSGCPAAASTGSAVRSLTWRCGWRGGCPRAPRTLSRPCSWRSRGGLRAGSRLCCAVLPCSVLPCRAVHARLHARRCANNMCQAANLPFPPHVRSLCRPAPALPFRAGTARATTARRCRRWRSWSRALTTWWRWMRGTAAPTHAGPLQPTEHAGRQGGARGPGWLAAAPGAAFLSPCSPPAQHACRRRVDKQQTLTLLYTCTHPNTCTHPSFGSQSYSVLIRPVCPATASKCVCGQMCFIHPPLPPPGAGAFHSPSSSYVCSPLPTASVFNCEVCTPLVPRQPLTHSSLDFYNQSTSLYPVFPTGACSFPPFAPGRQTCSAVALPHHCLVLIFDALPSPPFPLLCDQVRRFNNEPTAAHMMQRAAKGAGRRNRQRNGREGVGNVVGNLLRGVHLPRHRHQRHAIIWWQRGQHRDELISE